MIGYIEQTEFEKLSGQIDEIISILNGLEAVFIKKE